MKRTPVAALFAPLRLNLAASGAEPPWTNSTKHGAPRPVPEAEGLLPVRRAPNATPWRTFTRAVPRRGVGSLVWLPPGYAQESTHCPVVCVLHGVTSGPPPGATTFVPHADATDRTFAHRKGRTIGGGSMGGYGAAHPGFKSPALFGPVVINAGALLGDPAPAKLTARLPMVAVFGENRERLVAEPPRPPARPHAVPLRASHLRLGRGSDDDLRPAHRERHALLTRLSFAHDPGVVPGGAHQGHTCHRKPGTEGSGFHRKSLAASIGPAK